MIDYFVELNFSNDAAISLWILGSNWPSLVEPSDKLVIPLLKDDLQDAVSVEKVREIDV